MRIAHIAPLWEPVPPRTYGGTELIVSLLADGQVRAGHEVTLFATADSSTLAHLEAAAPHGFREMGWSMDCEKDRANILATELRMLGDVFSRAGEFDVIHNHHDFLTLPFANLVDVPVVTTLHNPIAPDRVRDLHAHYRHMPLISISDYQRTLWPELYYPATIYHGIEISRFRPRLESQSGGGYLAFLGRMCPDKGAHLAIEIAKAVDRPLIMAGKIDDYERAYWERQIEPHIDGEQIRYVGEANHEQKVELLGGAVATLCPIQWPEPFGLVVIESLACGTPVLAIRDGSIPEILDHGKTGFVGQSAADLIEAFGHIEQIDRRACRREVEERFSSTRMVENHIQLYEQLISDAASRRQRRTQSTQPGTADTRSAPVKTAAPLPPLAASSHLLS